MAGAAVTLMALTRDIVQSYRHPRRVLRKRLAGPVREDRALATVMLACGLIFLAQWPRLARQATLENIDLQPLIGANLLALVFIAPLIFYGLAGLQWLVGRAFGGTSTAYEARMALFWALLVATPLWLVLGLVDGLVGAGVAKSFVAFATLITFLLVWGAGIREVESADPATHLQTPT